MDPPENLQQKAKKTLVVVPRMVEGLLRESNDIDGMLMGDPVNNTLLREGADPRFGVHDPGWEPNMVTNIALGVGGGLGGGGDSGSGDDEPSALKMIGGLDDHIRYLEMSVLLPLMNPGALEAWGIEPPKGILFYGPPGTGKTLLAKTLAKEASRLRQQPVTFFYHKGGESYSKWFGESEKNIRKLFEKAKKNKPSIIFFDELDGLAPNRSEINSHAYSAAVTSLLGCIDSVKRGDVLIIAATNRIESVDPAVLRPGRFDKHLEFPLPDEAGRIKILEIMTKHWQRSKPSANLLKSTAELTVGYTGADLAKLAKEVVHCAAARCESIGQLPVEIEEVDWETAISEMDHSSTTVFGSALHVSQPPPAHLKPLIGPIIEEVLNAMRNCIPVVDEDLTEREEDAFIGSKTFLLYTNDFLYRESLHFMISRGILASEALSHCSLYELSTNTLYSYLNKEGGNVMRCVDGIINQVLDSAKPAILFLPHLDLLDKFFAAQKMVEPFYSQLERVKGAKAMIFATAYLDIPIDAIHIEWKVLFGDIVRNNRMRLRSANKNERKQFFKQLIANLSPETKQGQEVHDWIKTAIKETKDHYPEDLLRLYLALKNAFESNAENLDSLSQEVAKIVSHYLQNRLKFDDTTPGSDDF